MSFQKIFVLGAGAIGSCYGALLSRNNDVTLIGNKAHVDAINSSGLIASISKEERSKLVVNCVINPLTAILSVRNNEIGADSLKEIRHKIAEECVQVGKAEGISFEPDLERGIDSKILSYTNFFSRPQDILKGKKTEIDFLNGKIVELGKKHGIQTPVNETLVG